MTKIEFVEAISNKTGLNKADSSRALNAVMEVVQETLAKGDKISLAGFGTFEVRATAERKGHNPRTKEEIIIPAGKRPAFKPSKNLKDIINN